MSNLIWRQKIIIRSLEWRQKKCFPKKRSQKFISIRTSGSKKGEICRKQKPKRICCSDETNYYYSMLTQKPVSPYLFVLARLRWKNEWKILSWKLEKGRGKITFGIEDVCNWNYQALMGNYHIAADMFRVNWLVKDVDQVTVLGEFRKLSVEIVIAKTYLLLSNDEIFNKQSWFSEKFGSRLSQSLFEYIMNLNNLFQNIRCFFKAFKFHHKPGIFFHFLS